LTRHDEQSETRRAPGWLRPTVDYGPLAVFFAGYIWKDLFFATAALMAATAVALALSLAMTRKVPRMPLVTAAIVGVFGGLTLWLDDPAFIKMKPTIVQALFAGVLGGGLLFGKPLLRPVLGMAMPWPLSDRGWHILTLRWAGFFAVMAILNELVWRTQPTDIWVSFKVFGILVLTMGFAIAQVPLLNRYKSGEASPSS
jgi:intracellular septation protein